MATVRDAIARAATWTIAALALGCDAGPDLPDVLLVSLDTLRADRLGCYGSERDTSPNLDALAARGVLFEEVWAASSRTAPSHTSLFTGLDPAAHGVWNADGRSGTYRSLHASHGTLPERMRAAGMQTALVCESGNMHPDMGFGRGFETVHARLVGFEAQLDLVQDVLDEAADDPRPLFLVVHTYEPHAPYLPGGAHRGRFTDGTYRGPFRRRVDALGGLPAARTFAGAGTFLEPFEGMDAGDVAWLSDLYDENVAWTDELLGRLLERWEAARAGRRMLVVVTSDHGEEFGEHGGLGHVGGLFRELLHVPLVVVGEGVVPGRRPEPVSGTGLFATLLEHLGLRVPGGVAASFSAQLRGAVPDDASPDVHSQLEVPTQDRAFASLRRGRHQLFTERAGDARAVLLFDLARDPAQRRDASPHAPRVRAELEAALAERGERNAELAARRPASVERASGEDLLRELEALGYVR